MNTENSALVDLLCQCLAIGVLSRHQNMKITHCLASIRMSMLASQNTDELKMHEENVPIIASMIAEENEQLAVAYGRLLETGDLPSFCDAVRSVIGKEPKRQIEESGAFFNSVFRVEG